MFKFKLPTINCLLLLIFLIFNKVTSTEYVVGKLFGQLGNQMFQIAAATSLAIDYGAIATFPDLDLEQRYNIPLNREHVFKNLNTFKPDNISLTYTEPGFEYNQIPFTSNMELCGYFQSEKYFKHNKEAILKLFEPSEEILSYLNEKYSKVINHPNTVAVHIRTYKDASPDCFPFVGWTYIKKAIEQFDKDSLFVIFSDDIYVCIRNLRKILNQKNIIYIVGNSHFHDLYLISLCKNQIMSNSSFSWWGAYLNKNENKKIISPRHQNWFGSAAKHLNTKDIIIEGVLFLN